MQDVPNIGVSIGKPVAHGGDLGDVRRRHPDAPQPWIDLSTGINPLPYPVADLPADAWSRLPSHDAEQTLIAAAAARYRCAARPAHRRARHAGADPDPAAAGGALAGRHRRADLCRARAQLAPARSRRRRRGRSRSGRRRCRGRGQSRQPNRPAIAAAGAARRRGSAAGRRRSLHRPDAATRRVSPATCRTTPSSCAPSARPMASPACGWASRSQPAPLAAAPARGAGAVGGVRPCARDRHDCVGRRCVAAGQPQPASPAMRASSMHCWSRPDSRSGRHAAVQAGKPSRGARKGRRPRAPGNPCPRLRRSADMAALRPAARR